MSSDAFRLLGLDRKTATEADVRRAYAEKLKVTRPEDDREGFMALRRAFEQARDEVRWGNGGYDDDADAGETPDVSPAGDPPADEPAGQAPQPEADPVDAAYLKLIDLLTSPWGTGSMAALRAIIDDDAVGGIDEYQRLGNDLRHFLCDRTGMFLDGAPQLNLPGWLTLPVFDTLDAHFGWTRAQPSNRWLIRQHDWLVKVRAGVAGELAPGSPEPVAAGDGGDKGSRALVWLFVGAGIIGFQVIRFLMNLSQ